MVYVLSIAGSDSCGGAGIQADIRTISSLGGHALTAITAVTAQNSQGVAALHEVPEEFIHLQIKTIIKDQQPDWVKIGLLPTGSAIKEVAGTLKKFGIERTVLDPIISVSAGGHALDPSAVNIMKNLLLPLARIITPNIYEAEELVGKRVRNLKEMENAAKELKKMGPDVIITGGHLDEDCIDLLYDGKDVHPFRGSKIETKNTHGTGCVFSASLATFMARGHDVTDATRLANAYTRQAIERAYTCGKGPGTVYPDHFEEKGRSK